MKPLKPIDQYSQITILKEVKERFNSIHNFNIITGRQLTDLYYLKNYKFRFKKTEKKVIESIYEDIQQHQPKELYLTDLDRAEIRQMIEVKYETIIDFCREHPQFSNTWTSQLLNGVFSRITNKVKKLLETLEINL